MADPTNTALPPTPPQLQDEVSELQARLQETQDLGQRQARGAEAERRQWQAREEQASSSHKAEVRRQQAEIFNLFRLRLVCHHTLTYRIYWQR